MNANKILAVFFLCGIVLLSSCKKEPAYNKQTDGKEGAVVYVQQGVSPTQELTLFPFVDEARIFTINAGFGAVGYPQNNISVKFEIDNKAFDSVNILRQQAGLVLYEKFPTDAYSVDGLDVTIPGGALTSNSINVKYYSKKFDPLKNYLLPISIKDASGYTINPKVKTAFIVATKLQGKAIPSAVKITWSITADSEELVGEGSNGPAPLVLDGNVNTFWHSEWYNAEPPYPHWLNINMKQEYYVDKIEMAPRQNNSNGFAKFKLEGSLNGTDWTLLGDSLVFNPANKSFQEFSITPQPLQYIKITMLEGRTPSLTSTHLGEVNVYKY